MSWLRLYTSILNDPKVQKLPAETFRHWVNLLCLAKDNDGSLPDFPAIAFGLRIDEQEARQVIEILHENGLLDKAKNGRFTPHNWNGRQYISDVSTERVKRFRKRRETVSETPPETEQRQKQSRAEKTDSGASAPAEPLFDEFWASYPRKVGKGAARKAYRQALTRATHAEILAGAKRFAASKPEPQFTPHPATWLNADRWLDEIAAAPTFHPSGPKRSWAEIKAEREAAVTIRPIPHRNSA